jgi:hypothetical protein
MNGYHVCIFLSSGSLNLGLILFSRCLILAEIARGFETAVEFVHNLKRVFRYVDNERITQQRSKEVVATRIIHQLERRLRLKPGQALEVIIDWTWVGPYLVLSALIGVRGRAVPVLQWVVVIGTLKKSQNKLEEAFLRSLRRAIPRSRPVVIVADRGFGRTALFEFLPTLAASLLNEADIARYARDSAAPRRLIEVETGLLVFTSSRGAAYLTDR